MSLSESQALSILSGVQEISEKYKNKQNDKEQPITEIKKCQSEINKYINGILIDFQPIGEPQEEEKVSDYKNTIETTSSEMVNKLQEIQKEWVEEQKEFRIFLEDADQRKVEMAQKSHILQMKRTGSTYGGTDLELYENIKNKSEDISKKQINLNKEIQEFMKETKISFNKKFLDNKIGNKILTKNNQQKLKMHIIYPDQKYEGDHTEWPKTEDLEKIKNIKDFKLKSINYHCYGDNYLMTFKLKFCNGIESPVFGHTNPQFQQNQEKQINDHNKIVFHHHSSSLIHGIVFYDNNNQETLIGRKAGNQFEINLNDGEVWVGGKALNANCFYLNPITLQHKDQIN